MDNIECLIVVETSDGRRLDFYSSGFSRVN
jgi:hypothetical protein